MVDPITAAIVVVGALTAASFYQQRKMQRQAEKQANEMASHQISGHDSNRALYTVYGRALVGTTTLYKRVSRKQVPMANASFTNYRGGGGSPDTSDKRWGLNRFLYRISSLSNGPIDGIEKVLIDGESHLASRFTAGHSRHFEAAVSLGPTAGNYFSNLKTTYSTDFNQWDANKKGQGVAYVVERFWFDKSNPAYQGEPQTQYLVRGRKLYDPRLDSTVTGGSGTHRSATPSTWAFSDNPALALLDMLTNTEYGRGVDYSECDLPSFITAANKCDTYVDIPARATNQTGSELVVYDPHLGVTYEIADNGIIPNYRMDQITTGVFANKQKRFRLNMAVDNSKEVLDNIQQILQSFRANLHHINGEYAVHMDDVASPVITLDDDDIIGGLKISQGDRKQRINRMTAKFLNANKHYKTDQVSWPPLDETSGSQYQTYLTEDSGEKLHKTVTLTGCTDYYQAEDIAEYLVRESRVTLTATGTFGSRCFNLVPGDVVALNYDSAGYSGKYFIVDQVGVDISSMNVKLSLREYDSSIYTWNANRGNEPIGLFFDEEQQYNVTPTSPTIGTVSADSIALSDGTAALRLNIPFSDIPEEALSVEIGWSVQNADVYTSQVILDETATKAEFLIGIDDQVIDLRIRYFVANADGIQLPSGYTTTTFTLPAVSGTKLDNIEDNATRNQVFQQDAQPSGGAYQAGDIWIDTNDNFKMYMYDSGAWVLRADSRIATALQDAAGAQSTADGKIDTFYQDDAPTSASEGDLWIDTNDDNKLYRHDGTNFQAARDSGIAEAIQDAATAQSTADGKITTFFAASTATPTAEGVGDMWYQTDNAVMQRWNGSTWNDVASYNTGELADLDEDDVLHEIPSEGLTHYWPCNSIADVSGGGNAELQEVVNGKTGIHAGASPTISTDSPTGKSFSNPHGSGFTLLNDTDADALEASNGFAWSIWFKSETSSGDSAGRIITRDASDGWAVAVNQSVSGNQIVTLYGEGGTESMGSVAQGEWHHFCLSSDGSGTGGTPATISGYVNGELVSTEAYTPVTSSRPVVIGCNAESAIALTSTGKLVGKLTEIRAYNRALSAQEVRGLYKVPAASAPAQVDGDIIIDGSLVATKLTIANLSDISNDAGTITGGSVGGITITSAELYAGSGNWAATDTGFYLDNTGTFSLKDKLFFDPTNNTLTVDGNITADVITAKQNLVVLGDLQASSMATGSITRAMLSQDALDEIFGSLASSVGGSNGDFKDGSGSFTTSGGSVTLGTSSDKFDHGASAVDVEFNINTFFYTTTNYTQAQAQATLTFEATADGTFNDLNSADKTHTLQFFEYDLSSYYGYTYLVYYLNTAITKTFTSGLGNDLADNVELQFRVLASGVGSAFTGQTIPFDVAANEGVTGVTSTGGNADTLDNLDSTKFLRSDTDDTFDADLTITGDLSLQGDLNITGNVNSHNVTDLEVTDKTITVNSGGTQALSGGAGLIVDRNTATDASFTWNETDDIFELNFPAKITKSTINAPVLHLYHSYDGGYRDTLLIETPNDRDAGITFKTSGGQYEMWIDSNDDDSLIFSPGDGTTNIAMELYQNKNVHFGGAIDVAQGITFNPNGYNINADTDGLRDLFNFNRNGALSWNVWHTADQHLNFDPANSAYKLQYDGHDVWHRGDLSNATKSNYDTAYTYSQVGHLPLSGGTLTGDLVLDTEGTATSTTTTYNSEALNFTASGWDTNNNLARTVTWRVRHEPTASIYPDHDLVFSEISDGSTHSKFVLHGRGSVNHEATKAATFYGNVHVEAGTGTTAGSGDLTVAGDITSGAIDATGNSEFDKIDIVNTNQTEMLRIRADDTISNTDFNALFIDHNSSGSQAHTADHIHRAILVDMDSSATGGDTSNEHRVRGIEASVRVTGDSDAVYGVFGYAEGQNGASTVSEVVGVYGQAVADEHTAGRVSNAYALRGVAYGYGQGTGGTTAFFGTHSKVHLTTAQDKNCGSLHGGFFDVETDDPGQAQTVNNIFGVRATWDDDSGGNVTAANAYLFYGSYEGTNNVSGGKYGVFIVSDCENRFAGTVRTNSEFNVSGTTVVNSDRNGIFTAIKHDNTLDVVIDLDNNTYVTINNPDGVEAIKIGGGGSTDAKNTYSNDIHRFYKADGTYELAQFYQGMADFYDNDVQGEGFYMSALDINGAASGDTYFTGGTASQRRLTITTSDVGANANAKHTFKVGSASGQMVFGNNTTADLLTVATGGITVNGSVTADSIVVDGIERIESDGDFIANNLTVAGNFNMTTGSIGVNGNLSANFGYVLAGTSAANGFWVGSNQIVEGDTRNLKNIGTVDSGAITSTGTSSFANIDIGGDGLTSTDDLDSLTDGFYKWSNSQPSNSPGYAYFNLFQMTDPNQKIQLAWGGSSGGRLFVRRADSGAFYSWTEFFSTYHPPTLAEVTSGGNTTTNNITVGTITSGAITSSGQVTTAGSITAGNASTTLGYYVGATQVIQGSTRNLVNIGTILSGAITSTGTGTFNNSVLFTDTDITSMNTGIKTLNNGGLSIALDEDDEVASTDFRVRIDRSTGDSQLVLDASGNLDVEGRGTFNELTLTGDSDNLTINEAAGDWTINNAQQNNGITIYDGSSGVVINYNGSGVAQFDGGGGMDLLSGNLQINGVSRITAAGNATLGTISAGDATFSGDITAQDLTLLSTSGHTTFTLGSRSADPTPTTNGSYDFKPGMRVSAFEPADGTVDGDADLPLAWNGSIYLDENQTYATAAADQTFTFTVNQSAGTRWFAKVKTNDAESGNFPYLAVNAGTEYALEYLDAAPSNGENDTDAWHVIDITDDVATGSNTLKVWLGATAKTYVLAIYVYPSTGIMLPNEPYESVGYFHKGIGIGDSRIFDEDANLSNIGTISSGNITSSGTVTANSVVVNGIERIESDGDVIANNLTVAGNFNMTTGSIGVNGNLSANFGYVLAGTSSANGYWVGSNQIVEGDTRNLKNIGTISSGAITSSAGVTADTLELATTNTSNAFHMTYTDTAPTTSQTAMFLDYNASGNATLDADYTHRGMFIDMDVSSTGGDTANEYRAYGLSVDVTGAGDTDLRYAVYGYSETQHASGTVSDNAAVYGFAVADDTGSGHTVNNIGGKFLAYAYNTGTGGTTTHYAVYGKTLLTSAADKNTFSATGVYGEIEVDTSGTATTLSNAYVFKGVFDQDASDTTVGTAYLFHGDYQGVIPSTAYGIYIADQVDNYFGGYVRSLKGFKINQTEVIDEDRNLTSIGTISSGAITSTGTSSFDALDVNGYSVLTSGSQITTAGSITAGNASTSLGYYVGTTQVIQGSTRNLVNIGTIISGAITSSGKIVGTELEINSSANSDYLSGNASIATNGYIMATALLNESETGTGATGITFGNGSTLGTDQISLITSGARQFYISSTGVAQFSQDVLVLGNNLDIQNALRHNGNTDTRIEFTTNQMDFKTSATARLTIDTANVTIKDDLIVEDGSPVIMISDTSNGGGGGAEGKIVFKNTEGNAIGIGYTGDVTTDSDLIISTNAGGTYGAYLGLDAGGIADTQSDIILEPKTSVRIATGGLTVGTTEVISSTGRFYSTSSTVTKPAFSFDGDSNTGMYHMGADQIGFTIGGSNKVYIEDSTYVLNVLGAVYASGDLTVAGGLAVTGAITSGGNSVLTSDDYDTHVCHLKTNVDASLVQGSANEFTVNFNLESHNDSTTFSHSSGVVTVATTGWYRIYANMVYENATASARNTIRAYVEKNGTEVTSTATYDYDRGASYGRYSNNKIETMLYLTANDTVSIGNYAENEDGVATVESAECEFIVSSVSVQTTTTNADTVDGLHASSFIRSDANDTATGEVTFTSDIHMNQYLRHTSNAGTNLRFEVDRVRITAGNVEMIDCVESTTDYVDIVDRVRITAGAGLECEGNITAYSTTSISDINQKENIQQIGNPIEKIKQISGYTFDWKNSGDHSGGVIAQEIEQIMPSIVKETSIRDSETMKSVDYQAIIGLLVETVKDLNKRIEELEDGNN